MNIEFVDFYSHPIKKDSDKRSRRTIIGTVHIYIVDYEMDLRGILVMMSKHGYFFRMPTFTTIDNETCKKVNYPHLSFTSPEKQKEILDFLHQKAKPLIHKKING